MCSSAVSGACRMNTRSGYRAAIFLDKTSYLSKAYSLTTHLERRLFQNDHGL